MEKARVAKFKPKPQTYHEGANDERTAILAIVRRMVKEQPPDTDVLISGTTLIKKLLTRVKRNKARTGGL